MGDGIEGAPTPEKVEDPAVQEAKMIEDQAEAGIRNDLLTQAYGTKIPQRRTVDKE
jgi:hypothetical protein